MDSYRPAVICVLFYRRAFFGYSLAEDPYRFFTWNITWGTIWPLGIPQRGLLINGQFPGPQIDSVTNDNIVVNVFNNLDQAFLISWSGVQQRRNSWQDGVFGTNCPIPPGKNFTYKFQVKDQIGSYYYFPSMYMQKAAGGFGGLTVSSRPLIPVPFPPPDGHITLLIGDWYKSNVTILRRTLDLGRSLGNPDAVLINGRGLPNEASITVDQGKTYRLRISNVGLSSSLNFRIQGHKLKLVEVEGSHTVQTLYDSLDIHVGQTYSVLVTADQPPQDYYMVASTRFITPVISTSGIFHYSNSQKQVYGPIPEGPTEIDWSVNQARSIRLGSYSSYFGSRVCASENLYVETGKTYRLRISNVGLSSSLNFRIQGHKLKLVEVEGSHTVQTLYDSLDIHVGQTYSVLVTADQPPQDYYMVASTRFITPVVSTSGIFHYSNSQKQVSGPIPEGPTDIDWSVNQARSIRWNLTASAARPNPQGSYHYGKVNITRTIILANSAPIINGRQRYAVNGVSFVRPSTPMQLADYYNISGVYTMGGISDSPNGGSSSSSYMQSAVLNVEYRTFVEIVFQNNEDTVQSWHLDGYSFFVVGMEGGTWTPASRNGYNLFDAVSRCTTQVYPQSWTAILLTFDNAGMWNLRSETWPRQFLGQQTYVRVRSPVRSLRDEFNIPHNALLCGKARDRPRVPQ